MALSELHLALIGAGTAGVLIVWGYNVWQDRKHRREADRIFNGSREDALGPGAAETRDEAAHAPPPVEELRQEPTLSGEADPAPAGEDEQADAAAAHDVARVLDESGGGDEVLADCGDAVADCIVHFNAGSPLAAPLVFSSQRSWIGDIGKPVTWYARVGDGGAWLALTPASETSHLEWAAGLQLVDRRGAASLAEISRFCEGVAALAQQSGATVEELPDLDETVARAAALDQFCAGVDIQFVLHVVDASGGTFAGTKLRGLAEAGGMVLEADGIFRSRDAAGGEEFTLASLGAERLDADMLRALNTHGVTFSIDVPRVSDGKEAFERMLGVARQLAAGIGGVLVDAQRAPLADAMIAAIRAKILELQQQMRDGGIDPGSPRALRLFS